MKELLAPHWYLGGGLSVVGGLAYRFVPQWFDGSPRVALQLAGLVAVAAGLFLVARGVSRAAREREDQTPFSR